MLGSDLEGGYQTNDQPNGNSFTEQSRAKMLGDAPVTLPTQADVSPFDSDCRIWVRELRRWALIL